MKLISANHYIRQIFRNIKSFFQRGTKGYCDEDLWEIDSWFLKIMPKMLEEFKKKTMGWPDNLYNSFEEYIADIDKLIELFNIAKRDPSENKYSDELISSNYKDDIFYKYRNESDKIYKQNKNALKEAFELFYKLFDSLWW
jgi:hypothetical protein